MRSWSAGTPRTCASSSRPGVRYRTLNWPDLRERREEQFPSYRPLALVTARLLARRWMLYLLTCAGVFAMQAALYVFIPNKTVGNYCAELLGAPLIVVIVTVFTAGDATGTLTIAQRWERIVERAWAIIVLDVAIAFVQISGVQTMLAGASGVGDTIMGFLTLLLSAMLVYAEPFTAVEKEIQPLMVLPFAVLRSMMLAWVNMSRIFSLFAVQIATIILQIFVHQAALRLGAAAAVWCDLAFGTMVEAPLAALFTVAYLDTVSQERRSAI